MIPFNYPRRPEWRRRAGIGVVALLVAITMTAVVTAGLTFLIIGNRRPPASEAPSTGVRYQCPMHPSIIQDHPGECPICGMKLMPMESPDAAHASGERTPDGTRVNAERKPLFYRSPMNPAQTSPVPRKDEMGMDYVPVYADEAGQGSDVEGLATVRIDPARQQLIGLEHVAVTRGPVGGAWRTVGRVAVDETRVRHINVKVPGFVERIFVDFVGKPVRAGDPLFSVYSPELLVAQEEYLLALRARRNAAASGEPGTGPDPLVESADRRLRLWDVPASEIVRLGRTGEPSKTLVLFSPISGVVTKKDVVEGMKLDAGAMPYEIVDLSEVWVLADIYESELRNVTVGMPATLTLKAYPNRTFHGRVLFMDPLLDPMTRTVKVRLAFDNPTGELKPAMFGEVTLLGSTREGLRIPVDAVIDSGTKNVVFVAIGEGKFQPREVQLGAADGSTVEVASGLTEGERVVIRANFLVDSESRLRASLAALSSSPSRPPGETEPPSAGQAEHRQ